MTRKGKIGAKKMEEPLSVIEKAFIGAAVVLAIAGIYGLYKIWWAAAPEEGET